MITVEYLHMRNALVPAQATLGPCTKDKPGMFDMVGRAKWEAWNQLGSMEQVNTISITY